ncbi:MAG: sodium ion-translocating decarboxylase subunit beta, partial [Clostridia bacterium]|nr:sodium ion-translocating decarboxylase subunit beta [Clostridia bacterium]
MNAVIEFLKQTGFYMLFSMEGGWKYLVMIAVACLLCYLAIVKKFEPLLLLPIAIGMLLTNLPGAEVFHEIFFAGGHVNWALFGGAPISQEMINELIAGGMAANDSMILYMQENIGLVITPGLIDVLYLGVKLGIYPCLIF